MNILAIDTCCSAATAAVLTDDRLAAEIVQNNKKTHSQNIMPMIDFMMSQAEMSIGDIDCFAAAVGPGSFTGVRIGVATVKALAHAFGKPCAAVSALHAMAYNVADFGGIICPIFDARRGQVYNALFQSDGKNLRRLTPDRAISLEELKKDLETCEKSIFLVGDGANLCYNTLLEAVPRLVLPPAHLIMQRASGVALAAEKMAERGLLQSPGELEPNYLRLSQAERERLEKLKQSKGD